MGLFPVLGEVADGLSGVISLVRLDLVGAGLSLAAMVPFAGSTAGAAKLARYADNLDDLSRAAAMQRVGDFTAAGHSLTKHGAGKRPGNTLFPAPKGNPAAINATAQDIVDDILTSPGSVFSSRFRGRWGQTVELDAPDGRGLVFDRNGNFLFFKE